MVSLAGQLLLYDPSYLVAFSVDPVDRVCEQPKEDLSSEADHLPIFQTLRLSTTHGWQHP